MSLSLQLLLLLTLTVRTALTGEYYLYVTDECLTSSSALTDVEFIRTEYFNKYPYARFNSTVGEFVGFTEYGVQTAEYYNSHPYVHQLRSELERYCKPSLGFDFYSVLEKTVKPRVELKAEQQPKGAHTSMLMCSAYDFYPAAIDVYWQKDGKKVTTDVTTTQELADGDWYYQVHSHLEYTPRSGEKISCVVEHASFSEPMVYDLDPSLPESERKKIAIGASGLVLGIILSAAGFIYYKKKSSGRILVPT
ncbi:HLA class II histocompatibility antigen, DP beta 1 chain-like [Hoplias malabaricus]|uniref:HLA class II histocompatibility antigen, DP beta 1 chain-like n=1 Tax=Hoplias malabaricus TaxID=27720 RepID=UPI003461DD5B